MRAAFLPRWLVLVCILAVQTSSSYHVAVCVSGQLARWFPQHLSKGLITANPDIQFSIFTNIQYHTRKSPWIYNTDGHLAFQPTNLSSMPHAEVLDHVHALYDKPNSKLVSMTFIPPDAPSEWLSILHNNLDRIQQYKDAQASILNMYHHQELCMEQLDRFERFHNRTVDFVLSTREDIFYFRPLNLSYLLAMTTAEGAGGKSSCSLITKECLSWGGLHMRWQLLTRAGSEDFFNKRLAFYQHLHASGRTVYNPESFEAAQAKHYNLTVCELYVQDIPNVVVRHVRDGKVCFLKPEVIDNCVPQSNASWVSRHMCSSIPQHHRVWPTAAVAEMGKHHEQQVKHYEG